MHVSEETPGDCTICEREQYVAQYYPPPTSGETTMGYHADLINTNQNGLGEIVNVAAAQAVANKHFSEPLGDVIDRSGFECVVDEDGAILLDHRHDSKLPSDIERLYDVFAVGFDPELRHAWTFCGEDGETWTDVFYQGTWASLSAETVTVDPSEGTLLERLTAVAELNEDSHIGTLAKEAAAALSAADHI
jgi:hypothetical protein